MKRIMEEAQSKGSTELPSWFVEDREFRKFLKEAEKVRACQYCSSYHKAAIVCYTQTRCSSRGPMDRTRLHHVAYVFEESLPSPPALLTCETTLFLSFLHCILQASLQAKGSVVTSTVPQTSSSQTSQSGSKQEEIRKFK